MPLSDNLFIRWRRSYLSFYPCHPTHHLSIISLTPSCSVASLWPVRFLTDLLYKEISRRTKLPSLILLDHHYSMGCLDQQQQHQFKAYWNAQFWAPPSRLQILQNLYFNKNSRCHFRASQVALAVKNLPSNEGDKRDPSSIPGSGRSPGGGHGNPL